MISPEEVANRHRDLCVRPNSDWKSLIKSRRTTSPNGGSQDRNRRAHSGTDPTSALAALQDDIIALWKDAGVQEVLKRRELRLEDMPGL
jgi:guanine nucleotide-binding protein subunit alpha